MVKNRCSKLQMWPRKITLKNCCIHFRRRACHTSCLMIVFVSFLTDSKQLSTFLYKEIVKSVLVMTHMHNTGVTRHIGTLDLDLNYNYFFVSFFMFYMICNIAQKWNHSYTYREKKLHRLQSYWSIRRPLYSTLNLIISLVAWFNAYP